jgi:osomolarity two-component system, response regulator SSK1
MGDSIGRTLDVYYPGGQTIDEALIIEVPQRRTPRPSPRPGNHHQSYYVQDPYRPDDAAREYFPPMAVHSPHLPHIPTLPPQHPTNSIAILTSGQLAPLPSPGAHGSRRPARPKYPRQHTSSPTIMHSQQAHSHSNLIGLQISWTACDRRTASMLPWIFRSSWSPTAMSARRG